tara:strand:+ start:346 stop:531 length:186 start_codon:yes stop_codon:yes gene_type:complete
MSKKYNEVTVKTLNLAVVDEINRVRSLQRVATKPAEQAELHGLMQNCLDILNTINNTGVKL